MKKGIKACIAFMLLLSTANSFSEQTERDKRLEIIQYGLENEVTDLVSSLMTENEDSYTGDLADLFRKTRSSAVRESIIGLFSKQKKTDLTDYALTVLDDPYETKKSTVVALIGYVIDLKTKEALPAIRKILENENSEYRDQAINALGKLGEGEDAKYLVEYLDGEIPGEEKERLVIRQNVMSALGELKSVETLESLLRIAEDEDENASIRATAAVAVGQIGKPESIPVLVKLYESSDPLLRTAAISGLSNYETVEASDTVIEGFKDTYYKVRLESIKAVEKRKLAAGLPYLVYRAKTDPVESVQLAAYDAIGTFNDAESDKWLKDIFLDEKKADKLRMKACGVLVKNNFDFIIGDVASVTEKVLKDTKKTWLRYEIGKLLAATESQTTSAIAQSYLSHKDTLTRSIGLDMFAKNRYPEVRPSVEAIAADEKQGALQRRAKKILEK